MSSILSANHSEAIKAKNFDLDTLTPADEIRLHTGSGAIYVFTMTNPRFGLSFIEGQGQLAGEGECIIWGTIVDIGFESLVRRRYVTQGFELAISSQSGTFHTSVIDHAWKNGKQLFHTTLIQELRVADAVANAFAQCLQIAVGFNSGMLIAAPPSS